MSYFKNSEIAIFSDIHIGVHKNSKFWHEVSRQWVEWFVSDIKKKNIKDVVFCGDFFHSRDEVSVDTLHFGSSLLELFSDFNLTILTGNHDCYLKDTSQINSLAPFKNWSKVKVVDSFLDVESHGKKINFVPWGTKIEDIPKSDVTFGHFEIKLFRMNSFALCEDGFTAEDLLERSKLVFSGHFHLRDERKYKRGDIVYVGNPFQMDFSDAASSKGYYTLDLDTLKYSFTENTISPKHTNVSLSYLISQKSITDEVKSLFENNIVKFHIDRRVSSEDVEFLINKFKSFRPIEFNVEYKNDISEYNLDQEKKDFSGIDIEQAIIEFVDLMDINNKSEIIQYTLELYKKSINSK